MNKNGKIGCSGVLILFPITIFYRDHIQIELIYCKVRCLAVIFTKRKYSTERIELKKSICYSKINSRDLISQWYVFELWES